MKGKFYSCLGYYIGYAGGVAGRVYCWCFIWERGFPSAVGLVDLSLMLRPPRATRAPDHADARDADAAAHRGVTRGKRQIGDG